MSPKQIKSDIGRKIKFLLYLSLVLDQKSKISIWQWESIN